MYPLRFNERRSVERIVMNKSTSFALGLSKSMRIRDVATLLKRIRGLKTCSRRCTYSYISIWPFAASHSSIEPDDLRLTADASCLRELWISPKLRCFTTVSLPKAFTMKLFPEESQLYETRVAVCVCSCRNNGRRSSIRVRVSCACFEF